MISGMERKVICALDTQDLDEAIGAVRRLKDHVGAFKVGHGLTLANGLSVIAQLRDAGARRVFLDLKFHDIPNSVAIAVREAAKYGVWMMTLHISGGPAMVSAAAAEADLYPADERPLLVGVAVLTSLDQHVLTDHLGVQRELTDHMSYLAKLGLECGLDGVVSSPQEIKHLRSVVGSKGILICPGIRPEGTEHHDQVRVGTARQALADGADYLVMGRTLMAAEDPSAALMRFGLQGTPA